MKKIYFLPLLLVITNIGFAQPKNFIDKPFIETSARIDTTVIPDRIFLSITIAEGDTRGKRPVEELEAEMVNKLRSLDINPETQLSLSDLSSNFRNYFLRKQDVHKTKTYELLVYDARTAGRVIGTLEETGISNVNLSKVEYSEMEALKLELRGRAMRRAKLQAEAMTKPLNQSVGKALFISDIHTRVLNTLQGRMTGVQVNAFEMQQKEYAPAPIAFEKIKVESEIQVKFALD